MQRLNFIDGLVSKLDRAIVNVLEVLVAHLRYIIKVYFEPDHLLLVQG